MSLPPIECVVCGALGQYGDVKPGQWRLAPSRLGGYTCGTTCDDKLTAHDNALRKAKKDAKAQSG